MEIAFDQLKLTSHRGSGVNKHNIPIPEKALPMMCKTTLDENTMQIKVEQIHTQNTYGLRNLFFSHESHLRFLSQNPH